MWQRYDCPSRGVAIPGPGNWDVSSTWDSTSRSVLTVAALPLARNCLLCSAFTLSQGSQAMSASVWLPFTVDIVSSRTFISCSPKVLFCLCLPSSNVPSKCYRQLFTPSLDSARLTRSVFVF